MPQTLTDEQDSPIIRSPRADTLQRRRMQCGFDLQDVEQAQKLIDHDAGDRADRTNVRVADANRRTQSRGSLFGAEVRLSFTVWLTLTKAQASERRQGHLPSCHYRACRSPLQGCGLPYCTAPSSRRCRHLLHDIGRSRRQKRSRQSFDRSNIGGNASHSTAAHDRKQPARCSPLNLRPRICSFSCRLWAEIRSKSTLPSSVPVSFGVREVEQLLTVLPSELYT